MFLSNNSMNHHSDEFLELTALYFTCLLQLNTYSKTATSSFLLQFSNQLYKLSFIVFIVNLSVLIH